jgi:excinuclease ABC subunit B
MNQYKLCNTFEPSGDQPRAIEQLSRGISQNKTFQTLMGVTGSGKTFTMANLIARHNMPALVISHNKTLAAQLYEEFKELFPNNAVEYFVSYYDYYQPEAYIPQRDIYIEKDASRNQDLDRLRLSTTTSLSTRQDCIVVSSVSCIFGLGSPEDYKASMVPIRVGDECDRNELLGRLADIQYARNDIDFQRGTFRVRGDVVELHPSYESYAIRIEFFGDEIDQISYINPVSGEILAQEQQVFVYPAQHYIMPADRIEAAAAGIKEELDERLLQLRGEAKLLEAQRLQARTQYDLEMLQEVGFCSGIENYARHLSGLKAGARPYTLIDYFPDDFLLFIDESHVTIPQLKAMHAGDRSRKSVLVDHGFRLPSAMDNRPLRFEEFKDLWSRVIFVSATPGPLEMELCDNEVVEQVIRPTGLLDPEIFVFPATDQVAHLLKEIEKRVKIK